jgi:DnaD/phage-associated family protein
MASWFRSWHGAPADSKWLTVARMAGSRPGVVGYVFWSLLDYASQAEERGSVIGFDAETCADYSGFVEAEISAVVVALECKGIITNGRLTEWDKRQPKREDDSTQRVKRHRAEKSVTHDKKTDTENVTQCNAEKRNETHGNNTETDPETETETTTTTGDVDVDFGMVCSVYEKNMPGLLSQVIADDLADMTKTYGGKDVVRAIEESARNNGRSIRYVAKVLDNWAAGKSKPSGIQTQQRRDPNNPFNGEGPELIERMFLSMNGR